MSSKTNKQTNKEKTSGKTAKNILALIVQKKRTHKSN